MLLGGCTGSSSKVTPEVFLPSSIAEQVVPATASPDMGELDSMSDPPAPVIGGQLLPDFDDIQNTEFPTDEIDCDNAEELCELGKFDCDDIADYCDYGPDDGQDLPDEFDWDE